MGSWQGLVENPIREYATRRKMARFVKQPVHGIAERRKRPVMNDMGRADARK